MTSTRLALAALCALTAIPTCAAVTQLAANGFLIRHEVTVNAPAAKVYDAIVKVRRPKSFAEWQ